MIVEQDIIALGKYWQQGQEHGKVKVNAIVKIKFVNIFLSKGHAGNVATSKDNG